MESPNKQRKAKELVRSKWITMALTEEGTQKKENQPPHQGSMIHTLIADGDYSCDFATPKYFTFCGVGGLLACGTTHCIITPLDLIKCRIQANPQKYKGIMDAFRTTVIENGVRSLGLGWAPTMIGYGLQGFVRFGLYEICKITYANLVGPEAAYKHRMSVYLAAAASAEFCADIFLAPMEAVKVRMQTQVGFSKTARGAIPKIYNAEGIHGFYKGIVPLWMRQIPYTMMKFSTFEKSVELIYKNLVTKPRKDCTKGEQLFITFTAGYVAGTLCAIVSHPADVIITILNRDKEATLKGIMKTVKFIDLWTGLGARIVMVGALAAGQWLIYDGVKVWLNIPRPPPPEMPESLKR